MFFPSAKWTNDRGMSQQAADSDSERSTTTTTRFSQPCRGGGLFKSPRFTLLDKYRGARQMRRDIGAFKQYISRNARMGDERRRRSAVHLRTLTNEMSNQDALADGHDRASRVRSHELRVRPSNSRPLTPPSPQQRSSLRDNAVQKHPPTHVGSFYSYAPQRGAEEKHGEYNCIDCYLCVL